MKIKHLILVILFFIFTQHLNAFVLKGHWLDTTETYNPYSLFIDDWMNDAMQDSLTTNPRILFNFGSCLAELQPASVTQQPVVNDGGLNSTGSPLLRYSRWYIWNSTAFRLWADAYAITLPPYDNSPERYHSFEITINDSTQYPWNKEGGGATGGVDINTIFRHELGHAFGIAHSINTEITLMSGADKYELENHPWKLIGTDEINALTVIFDNPEASLRNNVIETGENIVVDINFPIPDYLTYPDLSFHCYIFKDNLIQNTTPLIPDFVEYFPNDYSLYTLNASTSAMELGDYTLKIFSAMEWNPTGDISLYETHNRPYSEVSFKVVAAPTIESPTTNEIYHIRPSGEKGSVTDTLAIKVRVPQILGSYPDINIKIDDVYVNPGDIIFDTEENVWVYNWDVSAETPTEYGKRYTIRSEIDGDPSLYDVSGVYLVEALFYEDFQTIADFASAGWYTETFIYPPGTPYGWKLGVDLITGVTGTRCAKSLYTYSLSFYDMLRTPTITIPSDPNIVTKLTYRLAYKKGSTAVNLSKLYFDIYDENDNQITFNPALATVASSWIDVEYDLSSYAGQTIKLNWKHHYSSTTTYCENTQFAIDDVKVFHIPDMDSPNIDFIAGNVADLNEDMNLTLQFNDNSGIESVTADYSIEEDSNTITLYPVKGTYNYTGIIPARDHECNGSISYRIVDSVGNETVSGGHGIYWALSGGGTLSAPENVVITTDDTTIALTWDIVDGATGYKVYSSVDPYGTFAEDSTGTFTESRKWEKAFDGNKYFYYIIATDGAKEEVFLENNEDESAVLPLSIKQLRSIR